MIPVDIHDIERLDKNTNLHRHILGIAQDMVYVSSKGSKKMPKHVSMATAIRHMTGSKELITMFNRWGHTLSYDEVERLETSIAQSQLEKAMEDGTAVVPSNISGGTFVQAAADNIDLNEETLNGKQTTHATSLVLYQRQHILPLAGTFGQTRMCNQSRRRSIGPVALPTNTRDYINSRPRPNPESLRGNISTQCFSKVCQDVSHARSLDAAWMLCRLCPKKLFRITLDPKCNQTVPSWTAFNATLSSVDPATTSIGYCQLLPDSPTQYNTVYTVMKTVQQMTCKLGQQTAVITFDEAIYCKAKEIQWKHPVEFKDVVLRMEGFHMAMAFLVCIGKQHEESGLEDMLIESDIYGSNTINHVMKGKSYNRGVRAHKLLREALERVRWKAFGVWTESQSMLTLV